MLDVFLERMAAAAFEDGTADGARTLADWVVVATGCPDPASHLRGRYRTALGRERLLRRLGGLEAVISDCARRALLAETHTPTRGDIGLIRWAGVELAAICLGRRWAVKASEGVVVQAADAVIRAWEVPHG